MFRRSPLVAIAAAAFATAAAAQDPRPRLGTIECEVPALTGVRPEATRPRPASQQNEVTVGCQFVRMDADAPTELYEARLHLEQTDLPATARFQWNVFADSEFNVGALAGGYAPGESDNPIAAGLGADVLVGGGDNLVALQAVEIERGSLAANVGVLELEFVRCEPAGEAF